MTEKINKVLDVREGTIKRNLESIRPPAELREQLDYDYSFENNTLILFEIRPYFKDPSEIIKIEVVKAKFVKSRSVWKIYWKRANDKWEAYDPHPKAKTLDDVFTVVKADEYGCFFG